MELPTATEINDNPAAALRRIRDVRLAIEEVETAAITAAVGSGWSLRSVAAALGVSRQSVSQRLQRRLGSPRPKAVMEKVREERRFAEEVERRNWMEATIAEIAEERRRASEQRARTSGGTEGQRDGRGNDVGDAA